ncbi:hypothetical protein ACFLYR_09190 [Chloroflexota bacterium]
MKIISPDLQPATVQSGPSTNTEGCPMSVFHTITKEDRFVKTKRISGIKITVSSLVMASLLALGIFSQIIPARTDPIAVDTVSLDATSQATVVDSPLSSAANRNDQVGPLHIDTNTTEVEPGDPYIPDLAVTGSLLVYTAPGKLVVGR